MHATKKWKIRSCTIVMFIFLGGLSRYTAASWPSDIPKPSDPTVESKVDYIWENVIKPTVTGRDRGSYNTFFDQLYADAAMGTFQVCIRWDSDSDILSPTQRDQMESMLNRMMGQWTSKLKGYDGWPWDTIPVRISGWAGYNERNFEWSESDNGVPLYIGDNSFENAPQCPQSCGRFFHTDQNYTYPDCPGGAKNHYDWSSWHSKNMDGMGFGSDWGQRTMANATISGMNDQMGILLHEMGHGYFLPDFYTVSVPGGNPSCVMNAGSAFNVTAYDEWMLKRVYSELKRIPGRFPELTTATVHNRKVLQTPVNRFTVSPMKGSISIRTQNSLTGRVTIDIFNPAGKSVLSEVLPQGTYSFDSERLKRGMYMVKISCNNVDEVHRVTVTR